MCKVSVICNQCGEESQKYQCVVDAAQSKGSKLFCSRECFCASRRCGRTKEEQKERNKALNKKWAVKNQDKIKANRRTEKSRSWQKAYRIKNKEYYDNYFKENKDRLNQYYRERHAKIDYGEYWECQALSLEIKRTTKNKLKQQRT